MYNIFIHIYDERDVGDFVCFNMFVLFCKALIFNIFFIQSEAVLIHNVIKYT